MNLLPGQQNIQRRPQKIPQIYKIIIIILTLLVISSVFIIFYQRQQQIQKDIKRQQELQKYFQKQQYQLQINVKRQQELQKYIKRQQEQLKDVKKQQKQQKDAKKKQKQKRLIRMQYQIPIVYIWLGQKQIPSRYQQRLKWIKFPHIILRQKDWETMAVDYHHLKNLTDVRRSDILRLLYLKQNAGIYSDLDNIIDYQCLMKVLAKKKGFYTFNSYYVSLGMSNAFLYVDRINDQQVIKSLKEVQRRLSNMKESEINDVSKTGKLAGAWVLPELKIRPLQETRQCIEHQGDTTWKEGFDLRKEKSFG